MTTSAFQLSIQGFSGTNFVVQRFEGKEGISKLFRFDVEVATDAPNLQAVPGLIGSPAVFSFASTSADGRQIHGVIARVTRLDRTTKDGRVYRLRLVPHLWTRKHHLTSRVFQDLSVPQIVARVLTDTEAPVAQLTASSVDTTAVSVAWQMLRTSLTRQYPVREYAVQYRESDFEFLQRILAEEGIYWYFENIVDASLPTYGTDAAGQLSAQGQYDPLDVMVLTDGIAYPSVFPDTPILRAYPTSPKPGAHAVLENFELGERLKSNATLLRDYDFERPLRIAEAQSALSSAESALASLLPTERADEDIRRGRFLRVYEHRGEYLLTDVTQDRADRQLQQQRRNVHLSSGKSLARHLLPGYRFQVEHRSFESGAEVHELSDEYVITKIRHKGQLPEYGARDTDHVYENEFECVPASVPYRPKRPKPRAVQVTESAVVVGKEDGSVYTDEYGRIRVQFHWDLAGGMNESSTTWLRVVQGWSGASYGLQFIPRVGMEVMVTFLGGDPDCPVVLGAVYNRTHPHPFHLPAATDNASSTSQALRSGIRTQSYPGGAGFNELSFEDTSGREQLFMHAERDLDAVVKRNQSTLVGKSQIVEVGESQTNRVVENQAESVGGRAERSVGGDETVQVKGNRSSAVGGGETLSIEKERRVRIALNDRLDVEGRSTSYVKDDIAVRTEGSLVTLVGQADKPRGYALRVEGTTDVASTDMLEIVSTKGIRLRCGESVVEIMPKSIDILSPNVNIRSANAEIVTKEDTVGFYAKAEAAFKVGTSFGVACELGGSLEIGANWGAKGAQISMSKPGGDSNSQTKDEKPPTVIELSDADGKPLAYRRFVLVTDGAERSFVLDKDGRCEVRGLEDGADTKIRFPELVDPCS